MKKSLRIAVLSRDGYQCVYCGATAAETRLHADHFIPRALGGWDAEDNLVTSCFDCNIGKSDQLHKVPHTLVPILSPGRCSFGDGNRTEEFIWAARRDGRPYLRRQCHRHASMFDGDGFTAASLGYAW